MDRRQALKNIGLGAGFLVATPTILSLLKSCASEPDFIPVFFSEGEGNALTHMVDLIIPADETVPGALGIGAHKFIDAYVNEVMPSEQDMAIVNVTGALSPLKQHMKICFTAMADVFRGKFEKELIDGEKEEFDQMLSTYLKTDKEQQMAYGKSLFEFFQAYEEDPTATPDQDAAVFGLMSGIRDMTIWAWKSSEEIGKNVLWYDPIPGQQIGCIPIEEAGNGNVMSL